MSLFHKCLCLLSLLSFHTNKSTNQNVGDFLYRNEEKIPFTMGFIWYGFQLKSLRIRIGMEFELDWIEQRENYPLETELHVDNSFSFAFDMPKKFYDSASPQIVFKHFDKIACSILACCHDISPSNNMHIVLYTHTQPHTHIRTIQFSLWVQNVNNLLCCIRES